MTVARPSLPKQTTNTIKPLHICIAFIQEYKDHRENSQKFLHRAVAYLWSKTLGSEYHRLSEERRYECDDIIKKLETASSYSEKSKIIDMLSEAAKRAQSTKNTYDNWPEKLKNLFVKDSSLWAKTLHAIRTCWVVHLKKTYKTEFDLEVSNLKTQLSEIEHSIDKQLSLNLQINKNEEETKQRLFYALLDRQDSETLKTARKNYLFPELLPQHNDLTFPAKVKVYKEYPSVYNPNYHTIFYINIINAVPIREVAYNRALKAQLPKYLVQNDDLDILNDGFFDSGIMSEEIIEESPSSLSEPSSPSEQINEKTESNENETNVSDEEQDYSLSTTGLFANTNVPDKGPEDREQNRLSSPSP